MPVRRAAFTDGSDNFYVSDDGLNVVTKPLTAVTYLWLDERDGQTMMFFTIPDTTVRVSTDGGDNISALSGSLPRAHANACIKTRTGVYLVGLVNSSGVGVQLSRSTNGGASWSTVTVDSTVSGSSRVHYGSFIECDDGSILCHRRPGAGLHDHVRVYRSTDDGATWVTVLDPIEANSGTLGAMSYIRGVVLLGTGDGVHDLIVHRSTDNGATWSMVLNAGSKRLFGASFPVRSVFALSTDASRIYFYTQSNPGAQRYFSTNQGASWTLETDPFGLQAIYGICSTPRALFITKDVSGLGLYRSTDDGASVTSLGAGGAAQYTLFTTSATTSPPDTPRLNYAAAGDAFVRYYDALKAVAVGFPTGDSEENNQLLWYFVGQGWADDSRGWRDLLPLSVNEQTRVYAWDKGDGILREVDIDRVYTDDGADIEAVLDTGYIPVTLREEFVDDRIGRWSWLSIITSDKTKRTSVKIEADVDNMRGQDSFTALTGEDSRLNLVGRRARVVMTFTLRNFFRLSEIIMRVVAGRWFRPRGPYD